MSFFTRLSRPEPHPTGPIDEVALAKVRRLVAQGKKIEAIRAYRAATHASLQEAVDAVEQITHARAHEE